MTTLSLPSYLDVSKTTLAAWFLFLSLCSVSARPVEADAVTASITVRAVVLPIATIKIIREPATLTVTTEDIRKGYVDANLLSLIEIRTNDPRGCLLTLDARSGPFKKAEVTVQGRTVLVDRQGGMIVLHLFGRQVVPLQYRFQLKSDTPAGTYRWPFSLSASPL